MVAAWRAESVATIGYCGKAPDYAFNRIEANLVPRIPKCGIRVASQGEVADDLTVCVVVDKGRECLGSHDTPDPRAYQVRPEPLEGLRLDDEALG